MMMKKIFSIVLLCALLCAIFAGCENNKTVTHDDPTTSQINTEPSVNESPKDPTIDAENIKLDIASLNVKYASIGWTDDVIIETNALNAESLSEGNYQFPVYRFDTINDLKQFKSDFNHLFMFDRGYDDIWSFNKSVENYDDSFFDSNSLIAVYITSGSGSDRFNLTRIESGTSFDIYIQKDYNTPDVGTCDMAGTLMIVEISDDVLKNCVEYSAGMDWIDDDFIIDNDWME
jgi:hypothetical protein